MRTHVNRLPEFYEQNYQDKYEDLAWEWGKGLCASRRLLIIDDEAKIRETYRRIFLNNSFDVLTASNFIEAKELLDLNKIDIVLLDINMPEADAAVHFDLIRAFHRNVKVVVSSVYSIDEQKKKIKDADAYFDKSDGKEVLLETFASLQEDF